MADARDTGGNHAKGGSLIKTLSLVIGVALVTSVFTVWLTTSYWFPRAFAPVTLSHQEGVALDAKLKALNLELRSTTGTEKQRGNALRAEPYSEENAAREVTFSERELNALLATNTDLADKVAINLSRDLISAKVLVPLDPDMPVLGGKTLKITAGVQLNYRSGRPVVVLKGVSLWGVPIPNAWLGNLKNVDLIQAYGDEGFWQAFAAGVDRISVGEGRLTVKLKE